MRKKKNLGVVLRILKILQIFVSHPQITYLDIGSNDISDGSLTAIIEILRDFNITSFKYSSISCCFWDILFELAIFEPSQSQK